MRNPGIHADKEVGGEPKRRPRPTDWLGNPSRSVFVNCPFDSGYAELFDAIVFTTVCRGFTPRSALDSGSAGEPRLARITRAIFGGRYSCAIIKTSTSYFACASPATTASTFSSISFQPSS
jgi:hypothetical protein